MMMTYDTRSEIEESFKTVSGTDYPLGRKIDVTNKLLLAIYDLLEKQYLQTVVPSVEVTADQNKNFVTTIVGEAQSKKKVTSYARPKTKPKPKPVQADDSSKPNAATVGTSAEGIADTTT